MNRLLFHPHVTLGSLVAGLTAVAAFAPQIESSFGNRGLVFCVVVAVLLAVCTVGRSPVSSVDNDQEPKA